MTEERRSELAEREAGAGSEARLERNRGAARKVVHHHARLLEELEARSRGLAEAPAGGWQAARQALAAWVDAELLPHARGEEATLYRRAAELPGVALLVRSLLLEHGRIGELRQVLGAAPSQGEAAALGRALLEIFRLHAEKENLFVLPPLAEDPATKLEEVLDELHALSSFSGQVLDVRPLPPAERHRLIFATWERLGPGESFLLVNDHDPVPLHYQFAAEQPGRFTWEVLEAGPRVWRVLVGRDGDGREGR
ncbi:MAG: DUF2249 domain-containing protein, partial [Clostridia bacterium]|nr:DUF2249 domain-containing protein [Clostridia bacterium]MCL6522354.1 DUF2249 domain-containing protein [Bacillota bacterium]